MQGRSRETARRILDAATAVLRQLGYESASTSRIAAVAGISRGSLVRPDDQDIYDYTSRVATGLLALLRPLSQRD